MTRRILLVCVSYPVSISRYLLWGFREAGCEVTVVGPGTGAWIPWHDGMTMKNEHIWYPDLLLQQQDRLEITDVTKRLGKDFDLVVQTDPEYALYGEYKSPVVCVAIDNHVRMYDHRKWDRIFGAHSFAFRHDEPNFRWLPCAYDPFWHNDLGRERNTDVAFVGVMQGRCYAKRSEGVSALISNGFSVMCAIGKVYEEYRSLYNGARMAFCTSANADLGCRVFEGMAMGCLVLTERVVDLTKIGFVEGEHYLGYDSMQELVEQVKRGMDEDVRKKIVRQSKEAVAEHTWANRARAILHEVGL